MTPLSRLSPTIIDPEHPVDHAILESAGRIALRAGSGADLVVADRGTCDESMVFMTVCRRACQPRRDRISDAGAGPATIGFRTAALSTDGRWGRRQRRQPEARSRLSRTK